MFGLKDQKFCPKKNILIVKSRSFETQSRLTTLIKLVLHVYQEDVVFFFFFKAELGGWS